MPLLMFLHGAGGTALWAAYETDIHRAAAARGWALAFPEGLTPNPAKSPKFLTNPQLWNDGSPRGSDQPRPADDVLFLDELIEGLASKLSPAGVAMAGFSNGAGMAFRFASERPGRLAALACVASHWWTHGGDLPAMTLPTLYLTGITDPVIPYEGGRVRTPWGVWETKPAVRDTVRNWSNRLGLSSEGETLTIHNFVHVQQWPMRFEAWAIEGHGHHWPGGRGGMGERLGGPNRPGFDGNAIVLDFLERSMR